ncbi:hypothetical protein ABIA24_003115 [Sinorhizobium fredii]|nr:hypothetical protein SF83666_c04040 [Sinorhizobium fredii CCBAU 83666]AWM23773.1 hypothetical protein AOX55_0000494 [Sinorhizobium fredii CCBAU 25509]
MLGTVRSKDENMQQIQDRKAALARLTGGVAQEGLCAEFF